MAFIVPESPVWLVQKSHHELAGNVLKFLGRPEAEFASEVSKLKLFAELSVRQLSS